jgi:hypothetical protein
VDMGRFAVAILLVVLTASPASAQPRDFCTGDPCAPDVLAVHFDAPDGPTELELERPAVGQTIQIWIVLENVESRIDGFSVGVATDPSQLEILSFDLSEEAQRLSIVVDVFGRPSGAVGRGDLVVDPDTDPRRFSISITAIFPILPAPGAAIPQDVANFPLGLATLRVVDDSALIRLQFTNDLIPNRGAPMLTTNYTVTGVSKSPRTVVDGEIRFSGTTRIAFIRGDSNGDGKLTIGDAAVMVQNIFLNELVFRNCSDMLDGDDDGRIGINDAVVLLQRIFLGASPLDRTPQTVPLSNLDFDHFPVLSWSPAGA